MKEKMGIILERMHQYNSEDMAYHAFHLDQNTVYDALVVAPSFTPYSLKMDEYCRVTTLNAYAAELARFDRTSLCMRSA